MYNQIFINDFDEYNYKLILSDKTKLKDNKIYDGERERERLRNAYLNQYKDGSDANALSFKESLDHYVLKQIMLDENYIKSNEFHNYLDYIMRLADEKIMKLNGKNIKVEFCSNIVFRDKYIRTKILKQYYSDDFISSLDNYISSTQNELNNILHKMLNKEKVNQEELDFISDYIYSSRNFNNGIGKIFAEYLFNEINPNMNIKVSIPLLGALTSYFTQCYTIDKDVKNTRTFVTSFDNGKKDLAHQSGSKKYIYFNKDYFGKLSLTSNKSINLSRNIYQNPEQADIYYLMMVSFHELTHAHQHNEYEKGKNSSSAMAYVVKNILNKNIHGHTTDIGKKINSEYKVNHDSTEYEMQADEESWRQCGHFIAEHKRQYAYKNGRDAKEIIELEIKCSINEKAISARRAFSLKKDLNGNLIYYFQYDIQNIIKIIKEKPDVITMYPMLKKYYYASGEMDTSIMFNENITSIDHIGLDVNNSGLEFATYIFDYEKNKILEKILSKKLTENQIDILLLNIYNVMHQNVLKIRYFDKLSDEEKNNKATDHKYDLQNNSDKIYNYFFEKTANELCIAMEVLYTISKNYPNIDKNKLDYTKYYVSYFTELLHKICNYDTRKIHIICDKYNESGIPILIELSNYLKKEYIDKYYDITSYNDRKFSSKLG